MFSSSEWVNCYHENDFDVVRIEIAELGRE